MPVNAKLIPSEVHAGQVGGHTDEVIATPILTAASAYASGNLLGGLLVLPRAVRVDGGSGIIQSVVITDKSAQASALDVVFFVAPPRKTVFTDKAAFAIDNLDLVNVRGVVSIFAGDYATFNAAASVATKAALGLPFCLRQGKALRCVLVSRGTPTYAFNSDLQIAVTILQD